MKRGPIGVWFSVALVIFGLGVWGGVVAGKQFAFYWWRYKDRALERSYPPERANMDMELRQLGSFANSHVYLLLAQSDQKIWKDNLFHKIDSFEKLVDQPEYRDVRPVIELDLGLAYVDAMFIDENEKNTDLAALHLRSAQAIFQSLGWKDYSEDMLKNAAQRELDKWKTPTNAEVPLK